MSARTEERDETLLQPQMIEKLERLGYYLLPRTHDASPGYTGLLALLRPRPHPMGVSDPESLHLRLQSRDGSVHWTSVDANTTFLRTRVVCAGPLHLFEHDSTESAFFTFGGTLAAETVDEGIVYSLYSAAPILCLTDEKPSFGSRLADEVEAILAQAHARSGLDDATYLRQLVDVDAHALYIMLLEEILQHLRDSPALKKGNYSFFQALTHEKNWLEETGQWPESVTPLSDSLGRRLD